VVPIFSHVGFTLVACEKSPSAVHLVTRSSAVHVAHWPPVNSNPVACDRAPASNRQWPYFCSGQLVRFAHRRGLPGWFSLRVPEAEAC
jgi:hypothetical protein